MIPKRRFLPCLLLAFGCSTPAPSAPAPTPEKELGPLTTARVLPLPDRYVATFRSSAGNESSTFVLEYFRPSPEVAHLVIAGRIQRLEVSSTSVAQGSGGILLRDPIQLGQTFRGSFGEVLIEEIDATVSVPAGTFSHCVITRETNREIPKSAVSTYCADVGLVRLTVEAGAERLETELLNYGPRVDLGGAP